MRVVVVVVACVLLGACDLLFPFDGVPADAAPQDSTHDARSEETATDAMLDRAPQDQGDADGQPWADQATTDQAFDQGTTPPDQALVDGQLICSPQIFYDDDFSSWTVVAPDAPVIFVYGVGMAVEWEVGIDGSAIYSSSSPFVTETGCTLKMTLSATSSSSCGQGEVILRLYDSQCSSTADCDAQEPLADCRFSLPSGAVEPMECQRSLLGGTEIRTLRLHSPKCNGWRRAIHLTIEQL